MKEIPKIEELEKVIKEIGNIRDRALVSFIYITGSRVSEVVKRFKVKDIKIEKANDRIFYVFRMYVQKRREKKEIYRMVGIPYEKNKLFIDCILDYINKCKLKDNKLLFEIDRKTVYRVVKKHFGFSPHYLRHTRATHLVSEYGFTPQELKEHIGWSDIRTTSIYTHLNWKNISNKL